MPQAAPETHPNVAGPTGTGIILRALSRFPDRTAFVWDGGSLTYAGTLDLIGRMQRAMAVAGLKHGQTAALLSSNRVDSWCAGLAAQALGLGLTWLHPMGGLADHLHHLIDVGADVLIVDNGYGARAGELAAALRPALVVLTLGPAEFGQDLVAAAEQVGAANVEDMGRFDDIATYHYTGGTTGRSKGAMRRHSGHAACLTSMIANFEIPRSPRYLVTSPMSHVGGSMIAPALIFGGSVHVQAGFDPERMLRTIEKEHINFALAVPTMIYKLLEDPQLGRTDLSSLELMLYGASPMAPSRLAEALVRIGPVFSQLYGQSECFPIAILRKGDHDPDDPATFGACGFQASDCDLRLLDDAGEAVATGEPGEICIRSPAAMECYRNLPAETEEALAGGWLHTGDIARQDERGCLYIVDRKKDMIISGGFNIYPKEVEDILSAHPGVSMVAVIGTPDARWGEMVTAVVVAQQGARLDLDAMTSAVKSQKGGMYAPKRIDVVAAMPLTGLGKIDKKALRARYWDPQGRQVN